VEPHPVGLKRGARQEVDQPGKVPLIFERVAKTSPNGALLSRAGMPEIEMDAFRAPLPHGRDMLREEHFDGAIRHRKAGSDDAKHRIRVLVGNQQLETRSRLDGRGDLASETAAKAWKEKDSDRQPSCTAHDHLGH
jgi:hypothetical protein